MIKRKPTMYILAGPNGAGKSTFYETVLKPKIKAPFVNADLIQKKELENPSMAASYEAAKIAADRRQTYLHNQKSFIFESTFSHPSKLALIENAQLSGFRVIVFHINVRDANLSVARVSCRVQEGGHGVPEDKIRKRYTRNQPLIKQAVLQADNAFVFDNSFLNEAPLLAISFNNGRVERAAEKVPKWAIELYENELKQIYKSKHAV